MARRRRPRPYVDVGQQPLLNFNAAGGPRITTFGPNGRLIRETITGGQFAMPQDRGMRIRRGVRTKYGVRDVILDAAGNPVASVVAGQGARLMMSSEGPDPGRRLVVGRGSATTGGGAAPTTSGADFSVVSGSYGMDPNRKTLNTRWGEGNYIVVKEGGKWVVKTKPKPAGAPGPVDPYAAYNDYPSIKNYLKGLDDQYNNFQSYLTNTYNPQVTNASQALTSMRMNAGSAYNTAVQNYSNAAGNVASSITTPQVAGATGSVVAPNQNALGAAQSMAATANVGRNLDAGYRTALGNLDAEKMGQSFLSSMMGYGAGLLNQYGQKRQAERLKMDQWIDEQKSAAAQAKAKMDLELMKLDQSMINSLIISGDKKAARDAAASTAADDRAAADARAGAAAADDAAAADWRNPNNLAKGNRYRPVKKKPGQKYIDNGTAVQATDGSWWVRNAGGSRGGGTGSGSGSVDYSVQTGKIRDLWNGSYDEFKGTGAKPVNPAAAGSPYKGNIRGAYTAIADAILTFRGKIPGLKNGDTSDLQNLVSSAIGPNAWKLLWPILKPKLRAKGYKVK